MLTKNPSSMLCLLYCISWMEGRCLPCEPAQSTTRASRPRRAGPPIPCTTTCPALTRGGAPPVARPGGDAGASRGRRLTGTPGDGSRSAGGMTWGPLRRLQLTGPPHLPASLWLLHSTVRGLCIGAVPYTRTQRIGGDGVGGVPWRQNSSLPELGPNREMVRSSLGLCFSDDLAGREAFGQRGKGKDVVESQRRSG